MTNSTERAFKAGVARAALIAAVLFSFNGCNEPIGVTTGEIVVAVTTTGVDIDSDGYLVILTPGSNRRLGPNDRLTVSRLPPGDYTLRLAGLALNCAIEGEDTRPVSVRSGQSIVLEFAVACIASTGSVRVEVVTTGVDLPVNDYRVTLDKFGRGGSRTHFDVGRTGFVLLSDVIIGRHALSLDEVPSNCDAQDGFLQDVTVLSGDTIAAAFRITCTQAARLAYVVPFADGAADIAITSSNGTVQEFIVTDPAWDGDPAWSPDRSRIAFASDRDGNREIYVVNEDGSNATRLTHHAARDHSPAWAPDGTGIVFVRDVTTEVGGGELWIMDADGSNERRLTNPASDDDSFDTDPVWSPDGARLAFTRFERGLNSAVYRVNVDGSGVMRLSPSSQLEHSPAWSGDGTMLAIARQTCAFGDYGCYDVIVITDVNGSQLAAPLVEGTEPAWSPDGRHIAYVALTCDPLFLECLPGGIRTVRIDGLSDFGLAAVGTAPVWREEP